MKTGNEDFEFTINNENSFLSNKKLDDLSFRYSDLKFND